MSKPIKVKFYTKDDKPILFRAIETKKERKGTKKMISRKGQFPFKGDLKIIKQAYKILYKEIGRFRCKSYCLGCGQCAFDRMMQDLKSFIEFWGKE